MKENAIFIFGYGLHWCGMQVFSTARYREVFWGLYFVLLLLRCWTLSCGLLSGGLLATLASYKKKSRPAGIPLAPMGLDVLLGRPMQASKDVPGLQSNNNVTIRRFGEKYVIAYRQSDVHFASSKTQIVVAHSDDLVTWSVQWTYANGCDLREVLLFEIGSKLMLYFFSLRPDKGLFKPLHVFFTSSQDGVKWSEPKKVCHDGEVPWEIKVIGEGRDAVAYKTSYLGDHYYFKDVLVLFEQSRDGLKWEPVPPCTAESRAVYRGGICEVSFEFTKADDLVAIGRNEDGDKTGFGSQLFYARKGSLGTWTHLKVSIPWRFDSPRLTSASGGELLLFARYAPERYQLAPDWLPFVYQKLVNLTLCSMLPKSAAVYRLAPYHEWGETGAGAIQLIRCFEGSAGDTGFFSVTAEKGGGDSWVVANYTCTTCQSHAPWIYGQMMPAHVFVFRCRTVRAGVLSGVLAPV